MTQWDIGVIIGPPLKKALFLVERPDGKISDNWKLSIPPPPQKKKQKKTTVLFLPKKQRWGEKIAAAQVAIISATRSTGNKLVFKGGLGVI